MTPPVVHQGAVLQGPVVQVGASTVRVARLDAAGGVEVLEAAVDPALPPSAALAGLLPSPSPTHPGSPPSALPSPAGLLVTDAAPAVAVGAVGAGTAVVLDVGAAAGDVALVRGGIVICRRAGPGGRHVDAAVAELLVELHPQWAGRAGLAAEARRVREAASLLPEVPAVLPGTVGAVRVPAGSVRAAVRGPLGELVAAVRDLAGPSPGPVLVVGGVARTPLLAELLDAAGLPDVRVPDRPETVAVLAGAGGAGTQVLRPPPARVRPPRLPSPPRRGGRLRLAMVGGLVVALLAGLHLLGNGMVAASPPVAAPRGVLVQYDYVLAVPDGWAHTGGRPDRRRILLTPVGAPEGSDLVVVESTPLGYDATAEPERAATELRAEYDGAARSGTAVSGYDERARFAGRPVTAYTEQVGATTVRWFVLLDGPAQLSVGCRHTPTGAGAVLAACAEIVASLRRT